MNQNPLIILGASVRAAAQSALRAGFQPYPIDLFADFDLQSLQPVQIERYPAEFLAALAAAPQAPWMYTGSLENYPRLIARLEKLRPLVGNGPAVLKKVRDPRWLAELLADSPVKFPETTFGDGLLAPRFEGREFIWKPLRSGGGMGIRRVHQDDAASLPASHVVQPMIVGQPISASFAVLNGEVSWIGATEQWIGCVWGAPQEFQYAGSLAPLVLSADEELALRQLAQRLARAAGLRGLCGLDLVRNDQGLWLIEVNPRYTASMELFELLSDRCLIAEHGGEPQAGLESRVPSQYAAKLIVYAAQAGSCGQRLQRVLADLRAVPIAAADVPRLGVHFVAGNPICTLLKQGTSPEQLRATLLAAAAVVRAALDS